MTIKAQQARLNNRLVTGNPFDDMTDEDLDTATAALRA